MPPKRKQRLIFVSVIVLGIGGASALALMAFRENLLFFFSPSQLVAGEAPTSREFRLGGLVVDGSLTREADGLTVHFDLTDTIQTASVVYRGILPDLFREGQGIVAKGQLDPQGTFVASEVLAKHDENYMPPEVAEALENAGVPSPHTSDESQ